MKTRIFSTWPRWVAVFVVTCGAAGSVAAPFDSATVTRLENKVTVGQVAGGKVAGRRPAAIDDVIRADNFLQTTSNSRAELQFRDKSLVRVGQNSVFSFRADTRTLSLEAGEMLFYVVPGKGGATIRTPTLTAAITGTTALVRSNELIFLEGGATFTDENGKKVRVEAGGEFNAVKFEGGKLVFYKVDPTTLDLRLYKWASLPEEVERRIAASNPDWVQKLIAAAEGDGLGGAGGGLGLTSLSNPVFGGGAGTNVNDTTTDVNPAGTVPVMSTGGSGSPSPMMPGYPGLEL